MKMYRRVYVMLKALTLTLDGRQWSDSLSPRAEAKIGSWWSPGDAFYSVARETCLILVGIEPRHKLGLFTVKTF
jgi:hypothetical protein